MVGKIGHQGIDHQAVLEVLAPPLVELEALLLLRRGLHRRDGEVLGRQWGRRRLLCVLVSLLRCGLR